MVSREYLRAGCLFALAASFTACSSSSNTAPNGIPDAALAHLVDSAMPAQPSKNCSPGQKLNPFDRSIDCSGGFCICYMYAPDGGALTSLQGQDQLTDVISMKLPEPMKAGQPYAFSVMMTNYMYTGDVEFWGANDECGDGLEKLYTEPFDSKTYCATVHPTHDYTYVLFVRQQTGIASGTSASQGWDDFYACPSGTCP